MKVLTVFGTRPEAIKLAPLLRRLADEPQAVSRICVTGQHREMLDQALRLFAIEPDHDLHIMRPGQDLGHVTGAVLAGVQEVIRQERPDRVVVQGDTTTTFAGALAAFYEKVPVAHVEAGLRTGDLMAPWPEEMNRRLTSQLADLHFPPTEGAREHLLREGIDPARIEVTGNTVIDALFQTVALLDADPVLTAEQQKHFPFLDPRRRLVLCTGHRRESFGGGLADVCRALARVAARGDVQVVYPVHLNPRVREAVERELAGHEHIHLIPPQNYLQFVYLMRQACLIVTDSGGIQEEAPSLGKPVLVTREVTERPEAVAAGTVEVVGTGTDRLVAALTRLLDDGDAYAAMQRAHNPYGDGKASERIVRRLMKEHVR